VILPEYCSALRAPLWEALKGDVTRSSRCSSTSASCPRGVRSGATSTMPGWSSLTLLLFNPEKKWSKKLVGKKLVNAPGDDASVSPAALPHSPAELSLSTDFHVGRPPCQSSCPAARRRVQPEQ
jgi:hypothetical protein